MAAQNYTTYNTQYHARNVNLRDNIAEMPEKVTRNVKVDPDL